MTAIVILAILASINVLPNGFTYDDRFVVVANPSVRVIRGWQQFLLLPYWPLVQGGDGYRPLTILSFALEWAAAAKPWVFHAVSMALYAAASLAVFRLASMIMPLRAAWWSAALFAVHPVHVEVIAGVVGQSELFVTLLMLAATGVYFRSRHSGFPGRAATLSITALYLAACLFKEQAVMLPVLLLAAELTILRDSETWQERRRRLVPLWIAMAVVLVAYLACRALVLPAGVAGFSPWTPFVTMSAGIGQRILTMLGVVPHWLRLLVLPAKLATEYGPPAYPVADRLGPSQVLGLVVLAAWGALLVGTWRRRPAVAFSLLWTAILLAPVSNVLVPTGVLLAERTLFGPSVAVAWMGGVVIDGLIERASASISVARIAVMVAAGAILILGVSRSIVRSADWRDNESLFRADVAAEPMVYRSHYMLGAWYFETGRWPAAEAELNRAMTLFDRDPAVSYNLAVGYFDAGNYSRAFDMFALTERIMPGALPTRTRMAVALAAQGKYPEAGKLAREALRAIPQDSITLRGVLRAAALAEKSRGRTSP